MSGRFPKDCWTKKCQHFHVVDLNIDDLSCTCDLLKQQCDACDEDFSFVLCPLPKNRQRIAVTWQASGFIEVEADSLEEAMNKVRENPDNYPLPYDGGEYVDGSFSLSTDDVDEMKEICLF